MKNNRNKKLKKPNLPKDRWKQKHAFFFFFKCMQILIPVAYIRAENNFFRGSGFSCSWMSVPLATEVKKRREPVWVVCGAVPVFLTMSNTTLQTRLFLTMSKILWEDNPNPGSPSVHITVISRIWILWALEPKIIWLATAVTFVNREGTGLFRNLLLELPVLCHSQNLSFCPLSSSALPALLSEHC